MVVDTSGRKCPIHKCWIQSNKDKHGVKHRFCPVCYKHELEEKAKVFKEAGTQPPNIKIIKY